MQKYVCIVVLAGGLLMTGSCRKSDGDGYGGTSGLSPQRKVRYELYTREDFSGNQESILFSLFMRVGDKPVFDSALAPMKVEDIPDSAHRIIIERPMPRGFTDTLIVGFGYAIDGVGHSSHDEVFPSGDTFRLVRFIFD